MQGFLYGLIRSLLPSSKVDVRVCEDGGVEARVRYSDMDWAEATCGGLSNQVKFCRGVREDLVPRRRVRRRLHWRKRR